MAKKNRPNIDSFSRPVQRHAWPAQSTRQQPSRPQQVSLHPRTKADNSIPNLDHLPKEPAPTQQVSTSENAAKDINISIHFSVPTQLVARVKQASVRLLAWRPNRQKTRGVAGVIKHQAAAVWSWRFGKPLVGVVVAVLVVGGALLTIKGNGNDTTAKEVQGAQTARADFNSLNPLENKNVETRYDSQRKVLSFNDKILGVDATISQQPLPDTFKNDPDGNVKRIAENFNAKTVADAGGTKVYIGKSANGPQSVIFQKDGVLVFMYLTKELDKQTIAEYVIKLRNA